MADVYSTMASCFTDYMTSAASIGFNNILENLELSKILMRQAGNNAKQLSKIGITLQKHLEECHLIRCYLKKVQ
jgi:hypothetical protein